MAHLLKKKKKKKPRFSKKLLKLSIQQKSCRWVRATLYRETLIDTNRMAYLKRSLWAIPGHFFHLFNI